MNGNWTWAASTREIISAAAYIYGAALDTQTQNAVDAVRIANNSLDPDDLLAGKTISDVLAETKSASLARAAEPVTKAALGAAYAKMQWPARPARASC